MKINFHRSAELHYTLSVWRNGHEIHRLPKSKNLILDSGLNTYGVNGTGAPSSLADLISVMLLGTQVAPTPVRRDSGAVTFTQVGTLITASGSFFVPADQNRLLKYNDGPGTEVYLSYLSANTATASISAAVGPVNGTVWYVEQTALEQFSKASSLAGTNGGDNGTSWIGGTQTMKKTIVGSAEVAPVTYTEIGFSNNSSNVDIFDRDIISGGISLLAGDQARCVVELLVTYSPIIPLAQGNVGTGCDSSGDLQIECAGNGVVEYIDTNGHPGSGYLTVNQYFGAQFLATTASFTQQAFDSTSLGITTPSTAVVNVAALAYSTGNFYRDFEGTLTISQANGTIYAVMLGNDFGTKYRYVSQLFTVPIAKSSSQTLKATWRMSWGRTLQN